MAIELIAKIKQANNGSFKLVDAADVELKDGSDLQSFLDNIDEKIDIPIPDYAACNNVVSSEEKPTDEETLIWIDTSDEVYTGSLEDKVIEEFTQMFLYMQNQIQELKTKNLELEARIIYLEENGVTQKPGGDTSSSETMVFEDGSILVDENGYILVFESNGTSGVPTTSNKILTFEDGSMLSDENNNILVFEN